jgi:hypothetical protein
MGSQDFARSKNCPHPSIDLHRRVRPRNSMTTTAIELTAEQYHRLINASKKWFLHGRTAYFIILSAEPGALNGLRKNYEMAVEMYESAARYVQHEQLIGEPERMMIQALLHEYYVLK